MLPRQTGPPESAHRCPAETARLRSERTHKCAQRGRTLGSDTQGHVADFTDSWGKAKLIRAEIVRLHSCGSLVTFTLEPSDQSQRVVPPWLPHPASFSATVFAAGRATHVHDPNPMSKFGSQLDHRLCSCLAAACFLIRPLQLHCTTLQLHCTALHADAWYRLMEKPLSLPARSHCGHALSLRLRRSNLQLINPSKYRFAVCCGCICEACMMHSCVVSDHFCTLHGSPMTPRPRQARSPRFTPR